MHSIFRKIVMCAMLCTLPILLSGCFLRLLFGTVGIRDKGFTTVFVADIGGRFGPTAICKFDPETGNLVECRYEFTDAFGDPPVTISSTSTAQLVSEFGILGLFIDPLILQVPADANNFAGTIDDGSGPQPIVVTEVSSFKAQPGTEISPEPGQKFVILEFPDNIISQLQSSSNGTLDGPFDFNFEFEFPRPPGADPEPLPVKAMFTGKVEVSGQTFYPPMLPCVTDFTDVPPIIIPVASSSDDNLMPQILDLLFQNPTLPCDNVVYDFTGAGAPPSTEVAFDIKPESCPNPLNTRSRGVFPVAVLGTADFDVNDIDPSTVQLEGVSPLRSAMEDVSAPVTNPDECDCTTNGPDGFDDLTLKFDTQDIVAALGPVDHGDEVTLTLTATLLDGTNIEGKDCVVIKSKGGNHKMGTSVSNENLPQSYELYQNHPNPFNPETEIRFYLPEPNHVSIRIYNIRGEEIRSLVDSPYTPGSHKIRWDGKDNNGNPVSSGIYLYQLQTNTFSQVRKMSLLR